MGATPVDYVCVRAEHNRMLFPARAVYAVHEGRWAYCPSGATGAHEWIAASGANLAALGRVGVRVRGIGLEDSDRGAGPMAGARGGAAPMASWHGGAASESGARAMPDIEPSRSGVA